MKFASTNISLEFKKNSYKRKTNYNELNIQSEIKVYTL